MTIEYIHDPLDQPIESIAGYYTPMKELRLEYNGREVLCILGSTRIESSHYLTGGGTYALIPGYVKKWKYKKNDDGMLVSEIETQRKEKSTDRPPLLPRPIPAAGQ